MVYIGIATLMVHIENSNTHPQTWSEPHVFIHYRLQWRMFFGTVYFWMTEQGKIEQWESKSLLNSKIDQAETFFDSLEVDHFSNWCPRSKLEVVTPSRKEGSSS